MTFVLASNNSKKLKELRDIFAGCHLTVITQEEAGAVLDVEETGETFFDNAFLKAEAAMKATGLPAIADDSGLMVACLGGEPGVLSKRYGGGLNDEERNTLLLENMKGEEHREAKFVSSIVCVFPNGDVISAEGECTGTILRAPKGSGGFGYDPIFFADAVGKSMAELSADEKNLISHRGKALRGFEPKLTEYLSKAGKTLC